MSVRGDGIRFGALRWWMARLLLVAFSLRAIVPVGYMPDFSTAAKGIFKVVICSAGGAKTIDVDPNGHNLPGKASVAHDQPCAFTGMVAFADPTLDFLILVPPRLAREVFVPREAAVLPPARAGPAHGSRAPPTLS